MNLREDIGQEEILRTLLGKRKITGDLSREGPSILCAAFGMPRSLTVPMFQAAWGFGLADLSNDLADGYEAWFASATLEDKMSARIEQMLYNTESATDDYWPDRFALALAEEFGVATSIGYEAMETPSQPGKIWVDLVRDAAVGAVLEAQRAPEPSF